MSRRALAVLALLAAVAVAAVVRTRAPEPAAPGAEGTGGERFLPALAQRLNDVTAVRVRRGGGALVARLERRDGAWAVVNRHDYPADAGALRATLIGLAEARRRAPKTVRPEAYGRLGVTDVGAAGAEGVEIALEGIEPPLAVVIGKPASGDVGGTYARVVGERRAWLVSGELERRDAVGDWLDARLVDVPVERVRRVRIEPVAGQPVIVARGADGFVLENLPAGRRPLSGTVAKSLARVVTALELDDVRPAAAAPELPRIATARFETDAGLAIEIRAFAGEGDDAARFVHLAAATTADADAGVADRAAALNARFDGWAYEIPDYKFVNATQTLEGVLELRAP